MSTAVDSIYEALEEDEFRLLELLPGDPYDEPRCRMRAYNIHSAPRYTAISYRWGETADRLSIRVNSINMEVMPNAYAALQHARDVRKATNVWIDCLCINQKDLAERSQQVAMTGHIFSNADEALSWLGLPDECLSRAMYVLNQSCFGNGEGLLQENLVEIVPLFELDYWSRAWIVQELLLPSNQGFLCGEHAFYWPRLKALARGLAALAAREVERGERRRSQGRGHALSVQSKLHDLIGHRYLLEYQYSDHAATNALLAELGLQQITFDELVKTYSTYRSRDTRDRIYALPGLWEKMWKRCKSADIPFPVDLSSDHEDLLIITYEYMLATSERDLFPHGLDMLKAALEVCTVDSSEEFKIWLAQRSPSDNEKRSTLGIFPTTKEEQGSSARNSCGLTPKMLIPAPSAARFLQHFPSSISPALSNITNNTMATTPARNQSMSTSPYEQMKSLYDALYDSTANFDSIANKLPHAERAKDAAKCFTWSQQHLTGSHRRDDFDNLEWAFLCVAMVAEVWECANQGDHKLHGICKASHEFMASLSEPKLATIAEMARVICKKPVFIGDLTTKTEKEQSDEELSELADHPRPKWEFAYEIIYLAYKFQRKKTEKLGKEAIQLWEKFIEGKDHEFLASWRLDDMTF